MSPPLSIILTCAAGLVAVGAGLIVISLGVAAALPRGHRMAGHLREFAAKVPMFMLGSIARLDVLIILAAVVLAIVVTLFSLF